MKKIFLIGWKDVTLAFRDRAALLLMLAAPFLLTLGLGFVTGRFSGSGSSGVSEIPVIVVNLDAGELGQELVNVFNSADLAELIDPRVMSDPALAREAIDADEAAAAVIIPAGFSASIQSSEQVEAVRIQFYANPTRPTSAGVARAVVDGFLNEVEVGRVGGWVSISQLIESGRIEASAAAQLGESLGRAQAGEEGSIRLKSVSGAEEADQFDVLALLAPGMALMFLMYTVSYGGRSLLAERGQGTLPRLLVSPTTPAQVLGGKVLGIYLTGVAQLGILILASSLLFQLQWGDAWGLAALVLAAVFGAAGWGVLITALARTPGQISAAGSAIMLFFGILGGSFIDLGVMPPWFQWLSRLTPNAWGLDGFNQLALGGGLADIGGVLLALLAMGGILFSAAALLFRRRGIAQA